MNSCKTVDAVDALAINDSIKSIKSDRLCSGSEEKQSVATQRYHNNFTVVHNSKYSVVNAENVVWTESIMLNSVKLRHLLLRKHLK